MLVLIAAAVVVLLVLAVLFVLITIAIRAEDKHASATTSPPPNSLARVARRITGLHTSQAIPQGCSCQTTTEPSRAHGERR
jgi:hypothetical protein